MAQREKQIGEVLLDLGLATSEQLESASQEEARTGRSVVKILMDQNAVSERDVLRAQAVLADLEFIDVRTSPPDPKAMATVPAEVARRQFVLPARFTDDGKMVVAMAEPRNHLAIDEVAFVSGMEVVPAVGYRPDLVKAIGALYVQAGPEPTATLAEDPLMATGPPPVNPTPVDPALAPPSSDGFAATPAAPNGAGSTGTIGPDDIAMVEAPPPVPEDLLEEDAEKEPSLADFLSTVIDSNASDLHLTAGLPPMIRLHGALQPIKGFRRLVAKDIQELLYAILTQKQRERFEENLELDVSYSLPGRARFRVNVFQQRDAMGCVMRLIPFEIKNLESLGLPPSVAEFAKLKRGLVLVTGITGSGKSTTLAGLVDIVNSVRPEHIMTVEDPIEFLHRHKRSVVNQREVGTDTHSFANALKHVLRQDPDVILVGEMRDLETIQTALTAAETGHLVFGTLHTQDAPQSVDRVIDVFPPHQQQQIRVQLAGTLAGIVSQQLLPIANGKGRAVAVEVLVATPAVRNLIREGKTHQIYTSMQAGGKFGMQVMDQHLAQLVKSGKVTYETALENCHHVEEFNRLTGKGN